MAWKDEKLLYQILDKYYILFNCAALEKVVKYISFGILLHADRYDNIYEKEPFCLYIHIYQITYNHIPCRDVEVCALETRKSV